MTASIEPRNSQAGSLFNFFQHFEIQEAILPQDINAAMALRHAVFCEELGYESTTESGIETDAYDPLSRHCFVRHKRTGELAGGIRVILPGKSEGKMAIEKFSSLFAGNENSPSFFARDSIGEVSRAVILEKYRRRKEDCVNDNAFTDEERAAMPLIAINLFLAATVILEHMFDAFPFLGASQEGV